MARSAFTARLADIIKSGHASADAER